MPTFFRDLRFASRTLAKNPSFAAIAILTLALGIGASTSIFSVVDAVLLRPLPFPNPQQIATVWELSARGRRMHLADPNFLDLRGQNKTLVGLAQFSSGPEAVSGGSEPVRMNVAAVSQDFLKVMGVEPAHGRDFADDELRPHGTPAMIISYGYWQQYLGGRADFSNVHLTMEGQAYSVVGVMPQGFDFPSGVSGWIPRELDEWSTSRTSHNGEGIARLRDGVSLQQARADLSTIARRITSQYGKETDINTGYMLIDAAVVPLADSMVGDVRAALLTLFAAVILLFLVACANVAGLSLARAVARRKELAVRAALGAGRARLVQQLLAESLVLALAGGAFGTLLAVWTTRLLPAILPANLPRQQGIAINGTVLLFTLIATLLVALGLGLFAAWRTGGLDLNEALGAGSRSYSAGSQKVRGALVIGEIAVTLVLLFGAGLLGRSFLRLISVNPGINGDRLILAEFLRTAPQTYMASFQQNQIINSVLSRLRGLPGVQSAGFTGGLPIASEFANGQFLVLDGRQPPANFTEWGRFTQENPKNVGDALYSPASADYFRTAGIPLLRGRLFDKRDGPDSLHVAVISEAVAQQQWPKDDPIGHVIEFGNMDGNLKPLTIVGVVGDVRAEGLDRPVTPVIYVDYQQRGLSANASPMFLLRTNAASGPVVEAARSIFRELAPDIPVKFSSFADELGGWLSARRFLLLLAGVFAGAALALAVVGIYGLIAHSVASRTQEIGIRMAIGGQSSDVLRLILGEGARLATIGVVIGIGISLAVTRLLSSLLFGTTATDPLTFVAVAGLLAAVALLAAYIPARRATRIDPLVALRYE